MVVTAKKLHDLWPTLSLISLSTALRIIDFRQQVRRENCDHSCCGQRHLTPAYFSVFQPKFGFAQTLAEVGLCGLE
jgi:hypothetical protein